MLVVMIDLNKHFRKVDVLGPGITEILDNIRLKDIFLSP